MIKQIPVWQTDKDGIYQYETVANELAAAPGSYNVPYGAKLNPPPAAPVGQVQLAVGDNWVLVADHRADKLFRTDTGEQYAYGTTVDVAGVACRYPGWGDMPAWLTPLAPPAPGSTWDGTGWIAPEVPAEEPA